VTDQSYPAPILATSIANCLIINIKQPMVCTVNRDGVYWTIKRANPHAEIRPPYWDMKRISQIFRPAESCVLLEIPHVFE